MMNRMNVLRIVALLILICLMISPVALAYEELAKGSKGDAVVELQERLNELGYSVGTADGDFGNKTYNAIVSYQTDRGLDATGIATVELQELMDKELIYLNIDGSCCDFRQNGRKNAYWNETTEYQFFEEGQLEECA